MALQESSAENAIMNTFSLFHVKEGISVHHVMPKE
jgi:hypothetical protein